MTLAELKKRVRQEFPALGLERLISRRDRRRLRRLLLVMIVGGLFFSPGLALITLALWLALLVAEAFYHSSYFGRGRAGAMTFALAATLGRLRPDDAAGSLLATERGGRLAVRLGLSPEATAEFLKRRSGRVSLKAASLAERPETAPLDLADLVSAIYQADAEWRDWLFAHRLSEAIVAAAARWVERAEEAGKLKERWWGREALARIPGLGKDWSYAWAYALEQYSRPLPELGDYHYHRREVERLEAALGRQREDNVLLISDDRERLLALVAELDKLITAGRCWPVLEGKKVVIFDAALFSAANDEKGEFERELIRAWDSAAAGNIILVIPELGALWRSAEALGSDPAALLEPYLTSPKLQLVAFAGADEFHRLWERQAATLGHFEPIRLAALADEAVQRLLEDEAVIIEQSRPVAFSVPALEAIAAGAERYFPDAAMPDAAIDLLFDAATRLAGKSSPRGGAGGAPLIIDRAAVEALIEEKTGLAVGAVSGAEREKLVNLEQLLHRRIIGQSEAIKGLAGALRRARSGVGNPKRPIGTFLFLGPTGVGKTETCKALAESYFGDEQAISRLDMSEYASAEALEKLTGSVQSGRSGVLADLIRDRPHGLLLLDEFEKSTPETLNLFLQILDEGFFSDMTGKRVTLRNHLIVATSNAASDLIWETLSAGKDLLNEKSAIIDELIRRGIFKPELLNRFDGVILFHPLSPDDLKQVARLQLGKLAARLKERGTALAVTDELVAYLARRGLDRKFGARAMNRAIQDTIEQAIADKLVRGEVGAGEKLVLTAADLPAET